MSLPRARPIVMTTIAMVGGMLPAALALESGGEFRAPMAVDVIGGLISSTVLSLVFVPAVFVLMDEIAGWTWRRIGHLFGQADEAGVPKQDGIASPAVGSAGAEAAR